MHSLELQQLKRVLPKIAFCHQSPMLLQVLCLYLLLLLLQPQRMPMRLKQPRMPKELK
jgi:hypothetical protein